MVINFQIWLVLTGLNSLILLGCFSAAGRIGLVAGCLISVLITALFVGCRESNWLKRNRAVPIKGNDAWGLNSAAQEFSKTLRMSQPAIWQFEQDSPLVFCIGSNWEDGNLAISSELLKKLSNEELRSVVALGLSLINIKNRPMNGIFIRLGLVLAAIARFLDIPFGPLHPFSAFLAPLFSLLSCRIINAKKLNEVDISAAKLIGDEVEVAQVLQKLESYFAAKPTAIAIERLHSILVNPSTPYSKPSYLAHHPSAENRIKRLVGYFPI